MSKKLRRAMPPTFVQGSHRRDRPYTPTRTNGESGYRNSVYVGSGFTIRDLSDALVRAIAGSQTNIHGDSSDKLTSIRQRLFEQSALGENAVIDRFELRHLTDDNVNLTSVVLQFECELEKLLGIYPNIPFER